VVDTFPSIDRPRRVFREAGFGFEPLESGPQVTAPSLGDLAAHLQRAAHTMLMLISDDAYQRGVEGLQEAAQSGTPSPVVDWLDLLAFR